MVLYYLYCTGQHWWPPYSPISSSSLLPQREMTLPIQSQTLFIKSNCTRIIQLIDHPTPLTPSYLVRRNNRASWWTTVQPLNDQHQALTVAQYRVRTELIRAPLHSPHVDHLSTTHSCGKCSTRTLTVAQGAARPPNSTSPRRLDRHSCRNC